MDPLDIEPSSFVIGCRIDGVESCQAWLKMVYNRIQHQQKKILKMHKPS